MSACQKCVRFTNFTLLQVLAFTIQKSDMDLRKTLYGNIVLSGGSTLFKGALSPVLRCHSLCALVSCHRKRRQGGLG